MWNRSPKFALQMLHKVLDKFPRKDTNRKWSQVAPQLSAVARADDIDAETKRPIRWGRVGRKACPQDNQHSYHHSAFIVQHSSLIITVTTTIIIIIIIIIISIISFSIFIAMIAPSLEGSLGLCVYDCGWGGAGRAKKTSNPLFRSSEFGQWLHLHEIRVCCWGARRSR